MADEALKKLEEQLNCSICLDTYTDPKLLQCFHVYCRQCLVPLVVRDQRGQLGLTCPTCRQVTPVPARGVGGLQSAFHINHLLEIQDAFQKFDSPAEGAVGGAAIEAPPRNVGRCFEHGEDYILYCETCGVLICWKCAVKGGKHHDHDYEELKQAYQKYKEEIASSLEAMEKQVATILKALAQLDTCCGEISDQRTATANNIHISFRRLREVLNVRETELIGQLDRMTQEKLKSLAVQRDQIETTLARLNSCLHFMRESLKTSSEEGVLMMKINTVSQKEELIIPFQPETLKPNTKADIVFSASSHATEVCQDHGCLLLAKDLADPSKCYTTCDVEAAMVGGKSSTVLQAINCEGRPCEVPIRSLKCEIASEITGTRTSCSVERRGQSQYEISYQPAIKGRHQLHIRAEGQHIRGSPFSVAVKSPLPKVGTRIRTVGGFDSPWGVAVNQRGEVVVTEQGGCCVSVLSHGGEKLRSFGMCGCGPGKFRCPLGVAVDCEGNILVADHGDDRIQKFTADGRFLASSANQSTGQLQIVQPNDVTFNASSDKICVVQYHCVQFLNSDLTFSSSFGKEGSGKGQFHCPSGIACDSTGKVYVADSGNHRIQVFTAEGKFLRMFGKFGKTRGELGWPIGVATDTRGMVYVSEMYNDRVSVFTSEGQFVASFERDGEEGDELNDFRQLQHVSVDDSGVVYVCDCSGYMFMF